jgi:hypothetical protein
MKTFKYVAALIGIALAMLVPTAKAALPDPSSGFGVGTTNAGTTLSWAIVGARSANNGMPSINLLSATSDLSSSVISFWQCDAITEANLTNSTTTLYVPQTNGVADNGTIIIRHITDDSYEKRTLTTSTGATNLLVTVAPLTTVVPGDIIYHMIKTGKGTIPVGATTLTLNGGSLYTGPRGRPLMVDINGTSSATLNAVGGVYLP